MQNNHSFAVIIYPPLKQFACFHFKSSLASVDVDLSSVGRCITSGFCFLTLSWKLLQNYFHREIYDSVYILNDLYTIHIY